KHKNVLICRLLRVGRHARLWVDGFQQFRVAPGESSPEGHQEQTDHGKPSWPGCHGRPPERRDLLPSRWAPLYSDRLRICHAQETTRAHGLSPWARRVALRLVYHWASRPIAICPRLSSLTETASPQSGQRMAPRDVRAAKIMSSKVSPSPSAYHGPSSAIRSRTSSAAVSGGAAKRLEQHGQYSSTCMGALRGRRVNC